MIFDQRLFYVKESEKALSTTRECWLFGRKEKKHGYTD